MRREVIGLVPAGGRASRLAPLPCSKELYPIGFRRIDEECGFRPKVVCHHLLERMRLAGISKAFIILRESKWDIPAYFGDGKIVDMNLAYLMMDLPYGVPFTLDQAYPFLGDACVALGFPDILFHPADAFSRMMERRERSGVDLVLGLFPASRPHKMDMVDLDLEGKVRGIQIKPAQTQLNYTWIVALWTPVFTEFMHDYVMTFLDNSQGLDAHDKVLGSGEVFMSDVVVAAINKHVSVDAVVFPEGSCLDIGSPEDLMRAAQMAALHPWTV
jgi:glucose-1-phosphate thymidylyltransferase